MFAAAGQARNFDFMAGDVGYVPFSIGHYIENTGDKRLHFLEVFNSLKWREMLKGTVLSPEFSTPRLRWTPS